MILDAHLNSSNMFFRHTKGLNDNDYRSALFEMLISLFLQAQEEFSASARRIFKWRISESRLAELVFLRVMLTGCENTENLRNIRQTSNSYKDGVCR